MFRQRHVPREPGQGHSVEWSLLPWFLVLTAGIALVGYRYFQLGRVEARRAAHAELDAFADLKVGQITQWRRERMADVQLIRGTHWGTLRALDVFAQPDSPRAREVYAGWLGPYLTSGRFERATLLDTNFVVRMVHPDDGTRPPEALRPALLPAATQALRSKEVVAADLDRTDDDGKIRLGFLIPLVVRRMGTNGLVPTAGSPPTPDDHAAALLMLEIDAREFLFPLVQAWPTVSPTAETMLVRRDGNDVLFLSELRHRKGGALTLRLPLSDTNLPAARAALGDTGIQEGVDYRGVPVVATARSVPDTPWRMVAKVDQAEIYAPLRQAVVAVIGQVLTLVVLAWLGLMVLWRRRHELHLRAQLAAERQGRVHAERFEHLMHNAGDVVLLTDARTRILEANEAAVQAYGWTLAELKCRALPDLRAPETRADIPSVQAALQDRGHLLFETVHQRKDGTRFPVEVSASLVQVDGAPIKLAIIRDITQRKRYEAEIRRLNRLHDTRSHINQSTVRVRSHEELAREVTRVAVEHGGFQLAWIGQPSPRSGDVTPLGWAVESQDWVRDFRPDHAAPPGCRGPGDPTAPDQRPRVFHDLVPPDGESNGWQAVLERAGIRSAGVFPIRVQGAVWGLFVVYARESDVLQDQEVALLEEATTDVAHAVERLQNEELRRQAEEDRNRLFTAMEQAAESIVITDLRGNIEYVNPAFEKTTLYTLEEALGRNPRILKSGKQDAAFYENLWKTLVKGEVWRGHLVNKRKDGTLFEEAATISPVRDADGRIVNYVAIKLDVTRERQLEAQFFRAQRLESVGALASGISHDLNNILSPVLLMVPLLRRSLPDGRAGALLDIIESSVERGAGIIKQLLTFARGQPGERVPVPLHLVLKDIGTIMRETFPREIQPRVVTAPDLWNVLGDPTQIHQAVLNLCVNARDAMPAGGTLSLEARNVTLDEDSASAMPNARPGPYVRVSVTDTGTGIAPEHLDRIFDPFFTTKEIGKGTGLGLAAVLGIVKDHDGCLRVSSESGHGAVFELYFPIAPEAPVPGESAPPTSAARGRGELILVVDDEPTLRDGIRRTLEPHGYRVLTASQGQEGLTAFTQHRSEIAAVVTDAMMPVMGGSALVRAVRALSPNLPVIVMTGLGNHETLTDLKAMNAVVQLVKPFSIHVLLEALAGLLQAKLGPGR